MQDSIEAKWIQTFRKIIFNLQILLIRGHRQIQRGHRIPLRLPDRPSSIVRRHRILSRNWLKGRGARRAGARRRLKHDAHFCDSFSAMNVERCTLFPKFQCLPLCLSSFTAARPEMSTRTKKAERLLISFDSANDSRVWYSAASRIAGEYFGCSRSRGDIYYRFWSFVRSQTGNWA